jgi:hypothetical protein
VFGRQFQQERKRRLTDAKDDAGEAQVTELNRKAQAICRPAPLADDGEIGLAERVVADQLVLGIGNVDRLSCSEADRTERRGM